MMNVEQETERARRRRERRERQAFVKHALSFEMNDTPSRLCLIQDLEAKFPNIAIKTFGRVVSYRPDEGDRHLVAYFLYGWFAAHKSSVLWLEVDEALKLSEKEEADG